jgi:hypothetical protein
VQAHLDADLVERLASEVEEGKDRGREGSSELVGQNNQEEVVGKACPKILDLAQNPLVVGYSRDHIENSSSGIEVVADVECVVGSLMMQTVVDCGVAVLR